MYLCKFGGPSVSELSILSKSNFAAFLAALISTVERQTHIQAIKILSYIIALLSEFTCAKDLQGRTRLAEASS